MCQALDSNLLNELANNHTTIFTVEEGALIGGFGSSVLQYFSDNDINVKVFNKGIGDVFIQHGTRDELMAIAGLDEDSLINYIEGKILNDK